MRHLAQRIERLLRNDFLTQEEATTNEGQRSFEDRQAILEKINKLVAEGYDYKIARQLAVEEWLTNFLIDNCMKC